MTLFLECTSMSFFLGWICRPSGSQRDRFRRRGRQYFSHMSSTEFLWVARFSFVAWHYCSWCRTPPRHLIRNLWPPRYDQPGYFSEGSGSKLSWLDKREVFASRYLCCATLPYATGHAMKARAVRSKLLATCLLADLQKRKGFCQDNNFRDWTFSDLSRPNCNLPSSNTPSVKTVERNLNICAKFPIFNFSDQNGP